MSIRPVEFQGVIQRTQDIGVLKQQDETKTSIAQQNIQSVVTKEEERISTQVIEVEQKDQEEYRYDGKEQGNSSGGRQERREGHGEPKKTIPKEGQVIQKGRPGGFDITI